MTRESFARELKILDTKILRLGSAVEEGILKSAVALKTRDLRTSREMIDLDEWVNQQRIEIMMGCFTLIATQQPTGPDMRSLAATLEIAGELERIHDYVKGIGKISLQLDTAVLPTAIVSLIPEMAGIAADMLRQAVEAFTINDATAARRIPLQDDAVDGLYSQISYDLALIVTAGQATYEQANLIQWAVHNLERAADRVINICEWVVYKAAGKYVEMDSGYGAETAVIP